MTRQEYIRQVMKHLECSPKKKSEIEKQLSSDIEIAMEEGKALEEILADMGAPETLAREFNENLGEDGKKKPKGRVLLITAAIVLAVLAVIGGILYWMTPKAKEISESRIFQETELKARTEEIIGLLDAGDYETLYGYMTEEVIALLEETTLDEIKGMFGEDWGGLRAMGNVYMAEYTQFGRKNAIVQINASYENVSVTYTLSFDTDMQLNGFYIK